MIKNIGLYLGEDSCDHPPSSASTPNTCFVCLEPLPLLSHSLVSFIFSSHIFG